MEDKSKKITDWLECHPFIAINRVCKKIQLNTANFMKYKSSGNIPEKYLVKLEEVLSDYGYLVSKNQEEKQNEKVNITKKEETSNKDIKKQIDAILAEKIPKERDTSLGRRIWAGEQNLKIKELQSKLK